MSPRKKEEWVEVQEAAAIISEHSGREISPDYVRLLAHKGHIQRKQKDKRTNLYLKSDVEAYQVKHRRRDEDGQPINTAGKSEQQEQSEKAA